MTRTQQLHQALVDRLRLPPQSDSLMHRRLSLPNHDRLLPISCHMLALVTIIHFNWTYSYLGAKDEIL